MNTDNEYLFNLINILSFIIGIENLNLNDKQIEKLESHLSKQDKQYEEIIKLLKDKEVIYGRERKARIVKESKGRN